MFKPASLFGSRCVLPMGKELRIFGEAPCGALVRVTLAAADGTTLACGETLAEDGHFLCLLPAVDGAQTGCTLAFSCGAETARSEDVAVGLTFLAGGQSNMELALWNADGGQDAVRTHDDPDLRYYNVAKKSVWDERAAEAEAAAHWEVIRPNAGGDMSAVAYFFAQKVRETLGVPVGVIDCYWGGTSVTAWMDEEALLRTAEGARYIARYAERMGGKTMAQWQAENDVFERDMAAWNAKVAALRAERGELSWDEIVAHAGVCPWDPPAGPGSPYRPAGLAETMLKRVAPASLSAFLYYQGEEDAWQTDCYDVLMESLIVRWRELFRDMDLPFLAMELPMYIEQSHEEDYLWPALRMAQQKAVRLSANSRLACIIDCGELNNIHPTDKRTPGLRLADEYLALLGDGAAQARLCPRALRKAALPGRLVLTLDKPVAAVGGGPDLFEIAGQDGRFVPAQAQLEGRSITLSAADVERPVMARYAWVSYAKVHVFGENGAPLRPFVMK